MAKLNYKEVVEYFDEISQDMAELVIGIIEDNLTKKAEKRAKISANLKKARAARGSKAEVATVAPSNPPAQRGRPRHAADPNDAVATAAGQ